MIAGAELWTEPQNLVWLARKTMWTAWTAWTGLMGDYTPATMHYASRFTSGKSHTLPKGSHMGSSIRR
jgi:hypothetical protein